MAKKVTAKNPVAPSEDESEPEVSEGRQESEEEDEKPQVATVPTEHDKAKRMTSFRTRTISTVALISMLLVILWTGHIPASLLVVALQTFVVKECFAIASVDLQDRKLPGFRLQQWYFFLVAESFLYLRFIKRNLIFELTSTRFLPMLFKTLLKRHTLISFCMYMAGHPMSEINPTSQYVHLSSSTYPSSARQLVQLSYAEVSKKKESPCLPSGHQSANCHVRAHQCGPPLLPQMLWNPRAAYNLRGK
eukprot:gene932-5198_t